MSYVLRRKEQEEGGRKEGRKEATGYPYSPYSKGPLSSLRSSSKKHVFILSAQCGGRNDNNSRSFFGHRKASYDDMM